MSGHRARRFTQGSASAVPQAVPTKEQLMRWIVESLYLDEAIPKGGLVQWYWQLITGVKLAPAELSEIAEDTPGVYAEPSGSKKLNFRFVLEVPPQGFRGFVEEDADEDAIDPMVWDEATTLLAQGSWPKTEDPAYKYIAVASWLQDASAHLKEVTFGRLLHLIRLCTHHLCILGHRDGLLVPWHESEEHERLANAAAGQPTSVKSDEQFVETWDELKECLRYFIRISQTKEVEVSKLKLLFRTHCQKELSETVFGHTTMSKLLGDPQLGTEFHVDNSRLPGKKGGSNANGSRLAIIFTKREDELAQSPTPKSVARIKAAEKRQAKEEKKLAASVVKQPETQAEPKTAKKPAKAADYHPPGMIAPSSGVETPPKHLSPAAQMVSKILEPNSKGKVPTKLAPPPGLAPPEQIEKESKDPAPATAAAAPATPSKRLAIANSRSGQPVEVPLYAALKNRKSPVVQGVPAPRKAGIVVQ